jgi:hypothetical protein
MTSLSKPIELKETQVSHYEKVCNTLQRMYGFIDASVMGAGKTYVSCAIAQKYGFPLLVICPVGVSDVWRKVTAEYGIPVVDIIGFEKLRSTKNHQPTHGLLERYDPPPNPAHSGAPKVSVSFTPTPHYLEWVRSGILLIIDECQKIKNDSDQNKACTALTSAICDEGSRSRFGLLSGSPIDKEEQCINVMRVMGFIHGKAYDYDHRTKKYILTGAQRLVNLCGVYDKTTTEELRSKPIKSAGDVTTLCYQLFIQVLKPLMASAMPSPIITATKTAVNGYYNLDDDNAAKLSRAIKALKDATRYNDQTGRVDLRDADFGAITNALMAIEQPKVSILSREAAITLQAPGKVVLYVSYTASVNQLAADLQFFSPLVLTGKVAPKKRKETVDRFQNDPTARLLIANIKVGGVGISLHDTVGDQPRTTFLVPNYSVLDLHQAAYRTYRMGTASNVKIVFVYGNVSVQESGILDALARKTNVLKDFLDQQVEEAVLFPGDYPDWIQGGVAAFSKPQIGDLSSRMSALNLDDNQSDEDES